MSVGVVLFYQMSEITLSSKQIINENQITHK
jgi:hypothetical protein